MEAMRRRRRRLPDVVYRQLVTDAAQKTVDGAAPGGHSGATTKSSATDLTPDIGSSDKPLPEPAAATLPGDLPQPAATSGSGDSRPHATARRRCHVERPTGRTTLTPTSTGAPSMASRTSPLDS
jgi:hypothetical protein